MKLLHLLCIVCLGVFSSNALAEPAIAEVGYDCFIGWVSAEPLEPADFPNIVLIPGSGVQVTTNNGRTHLQKHCKTYLDFGQPVMGINAFTGDIVYVILAGIAQACDELGFCPGGVNGAVRVDASSGFICNTPFGPTYDFQLVVAPGGQAMLSCKLHEPPNE